MLYRATGVWRIALRCRELMIPDFRSTAAPASCLLCVTASQGCSWCPARPYSSSNAGTSRVVLRHRAAAAACACLMWIGLRQRHTARRRPQPRLGQQMAFCTTHIQGFYKKFFSNMVFYNYGLHRKLFSYHVRYHSFFSVGGGFD